MECFAADDIFCNYVSEAARIVEEGIATPAQVDAIVHAAIGGGGPFNVMDRTKGSLLTYKCQLLMQHAPTGTAWFAPPAILAKQGDTLWHDRDHPDDGRHTDALAKVVLDRILAVLLARTYFVVEQKIATETDTNCRPEVKNALNKRTLREIDEAIREFVDDDGVKGIVLTSTDGSLAGADITELAALSDPSECEMTCLQAHPIFERIRCASHATRGHSREQQRTGTLFALLDDTTRRYGYLGRSASVGCGPVPHRPRRDGHGAALAPRQYLRREGNGVACRSRCDRSRAHSGAHL